MGIDEKLSDETKEYLLNEISDYIFESETVKQTNEKLFDLELDFKYYYPDFLKYDIDLMEEDISWFKFNSILTAIFVSKDSTMNKIIQYRAYKKPTKNAKTAEAEEHKMYMDLKRQYKLPNDNSENNLEKLWKYVEKRAGDDNE